MEPGKLFIGGISWDTNEDRLREYFQVYGDVVETVIMKDRTTGRARGFGFVVFADPSVAEKVVKERHMIDGRNVEAKKAVPRDDQHITRNNGSIPGSPGPARTKKIFVGGLASSITESDFKKYFDQFGTITDVVVMYDPSTQKPRGFGFITYDSEEAVDKVLYKTFHELNGKRVEVKRAVPKELSPGPTRNQSGGFQLNFVPNKVNEFLNGYAQGYNPSPMVSHGVQMEGRFSPMEYDMRTSMDSTLSSNYGGNGSVSSSFGYGRGFGSFYNGSSNRYNGPVGRVGSDSTLNSAGWNLWNNESLGTIWSSSSILGQDGGNSSFDSGKITYNSGENSFAHGSRNAGRSAVTTSLYARMKDIHARASGNLYESKGGSFYEDLTWGSSSPELDSSSSFNYGLGTADSLGFIGDYSIANRSNRGVAA